MSKKHRKISLVFIGFLLTLLTIVSFAEAPEAPNQLITENPYKEVKTVEANKNREHAEMKISVNKLNPKAISGYKINDNEFYIELPSDEILKENETYYISKNIEDLPNIYTVNGKKTITNLKRFENYSIETADFNYGILENIILIDKAPLGINEFIVSKLDKLSGEIKKVYKVENLKKVERSEIYGEIEDKKSEYIVFALNDEILKELTVGTEIKIGKNFNEILKNKDKKLNKRNNELFYKINENSKQLLVENREDINEIKILVLSNNRINKIYTGNIVFKSNIEIRNSAFRKFAKYKRPKLIGLSDGNFLIQFGEFVRANLIIGSYLETNDSPSGNPLRFNFLIESYHSMGKFIEDSKEKLYDTGASYKLFSNENPGGIITEQIPLYKYNSFLYGDIRYGEWGSERVKDGQTVNMFDGTRIHGHGYTTGDGYSGWALSWPLQIKLSKERYNEMRKKGLNKIRNNNDVNGVIRSFSSDTDYTRLNILLMRQDEISAEFDETQIPPIVEPLYESGTIELQNPILKKNTETTNGGILAYSNFGKLMASTEGKTQNIHRTFGNILQIRGQEGYLGSRYVNIKGNVIRGSGFGANIDGMYLDLGNNIHLSDTTFITGDNELTVSYPNSNIQSNKNGILLGIKKWDLKEGEYQVKLDHPFIKNTLNIKLPNFDASVYYNPIPNKEIILSNHNRIGKELGKFRLTTKDFNTDIFGKDVQLPEATKFSYEIKKRLQAKVNINGEVKTISIKTKINNIKAATTLIGEDNDKYYVHTKYGASNYDIGIDVILEIEEELPSKNQIIIINESNIVTLGVKGENIGRSEVINKITINETISEKYEANIYYDLKNAVLIEASGTSFYGWNLIYPTSNIDNNAVVGIVDNNNYIVNDNRKNNQFKALKATGKTTALKESDLGKKIKITVGNQVQEVNLASGNSDSNALDYKTFNLNGLTVQIDYESVAQYNGAMYFAFSNWDKEAKNFTIKVEFSDRINIYNVTIPEFDGEVYYNKNIAQVAPTEINYPTKTLHGRFIREHSGQMGIKFNVGTKDYDLRILGQYNGNTNLKLKIPKQVTLKVRDDLGVENEIPFYTEILTLNSGVKGENSNYYCIFAPNDGINNNSEINATIVLKTLFKNNNVSWNYITGENLNLVSIGANSTSGEKNFTIIDNVDLKMELANFNETIDVSHVDISQKVYSRNGYYGLIQNENKLILKDGSRKILETTFEELTKTKKEISEAGINIKYNYGSSQDINRNQFEFEKTKGINYNKTLRLEVHTSNGQLLYYIDFNIINKVGFEILPGKGKLDFGDFFPGDVKRAESLIEFKNPNNANINISLSPTNNYKMFKKGASISPNTTILLNDLQIKDLKKGANSTNNFKISGIATTTKDTLPGEYSGELDVIITIVP